VRKSVSIDCSPAGLIEPFARRVCQIGAIDVAERKIQLREPTGPIATKERRARRANALDQSARVVDSPLRKRLIAGSIASNCSPAQLLGHEDIRTTEIYVQADEHAATAAHSPLASLLANPKALPQVQANELPESIKLRLYTG
jgi:hypothetical protein